MPIFEGFYMKSSVEAVLTVCSNDFALLNKVAVMHIYGKNTSKSSPEPRKL